MASRAAGPARVPTPADTPPRAVIASPSSPARRMDTAKDAPRRSAGSASTRRIARLNFLAGRTSPFPSEESSVIDRPWRAGRSRLAASSVRISSTSNGRQRTHRATVTATSSTGTRSLRKGAPSLLNAGARSPRGVVQATRADEARRTTPKATARRNVSNDPKPTWTGPTASVGGRPAANASSAPIKSDPQNHPGSRGTTVRGILANRAATRSSEANNAMQGQLGTSVRVTTIATTARTFVPAQSRCIGLAPGTSRSTYTVPGCRDRRRAVGTPMPIR